MNCHKFLYHHFKRAHNFLLFRHKFSSLSTKATFSFRIIHLISILSKTVKTLSKNGFICEGTHIYIYIYIYIYIIGFAFISMFCLPNKLHLKHSILLPRVCLLNMTKVFINIFASTKEMISDV